GCGGRPDPLGAGDAGGGRESWDGDDRGAWGAEGAEGAWEAGERARELARTGLGLAHGLFTAAVALFAVGAGAFLLARRRR
ncbi:hypothetical protein ACFV23_53715, partial [Streptomyces sp. NPDC059627]